MKTSMILTRILILSFLFQLSFASGFGHTKLNIERTWNITSNGQFNFTTALAVNDSNQKITSYSLTPGFVEYIDENETLWLRYEGNESIVLTANATVEVDYNPHIRQDRQLPNATLRFSNLTAANEGITRQARSLVYAGSSLKTIRNLVNWIHENITYDLKYWGKNKPAKDVYAERHGVCVEYTHLFISMARSLGFEARYISGYTLSTNWQPHAWAEVKIPGYGWIAVDPTFGQIGTLDSERLADHKGEDQSTVYDILVSTDENADISAEIDMTETLSVPDAKGVKVELKLDNRTSTVETVITNTRSEYVYGFYHLILPQGYGEEEQYVILIEPDETVVVDRSLDQTALQQGFLYNIPVRASFNDAEANGMMKITTSVFEHEIQSDNNDRQQICISGFLAPVFVIISALFGKTRLEV